MVDHKKYLLHFIENHAINTLNYYRYFSKPKTQQNKKELFTKDWDSSQNGADLVNGNEQRIEIKATLSKHRWAHNLFGYHSDGRQKGKVIMFYLIEDKPVEAITTLRVKVIKFNLNTKRHEEFNYHQFIKTGELKMTTQDIMKLIRKDRDDAWREALKRADGDEQKAMLLYDQCYDELE